MKKTLFAGLLSCTLALAFAVPTLAHGHQTCRQYPVSQEAHVCRESCSYLDEDGDGICEHRQSCQEDSPYRDQNSCGSGRSDHHSGSGYGRHCRR